MRSHPTSGKTSVEKDKTAFFRPATSDKSALGATRVSIYSNQNVGVSNSERRKTKGRSTALEVQLSMSLDLQRALCQGTQQSSQSVLHFPELGLKSSPSPADS